jgi:hypothetical protein
MTKSILLLVFSLLLTANCRAETGCASPADVKYRGPVDLAHLSCKPIDRSSFIGCVCYDRANAYMIVKLKETYYHYCDIDADTMNLFLTADSMGRYYNASIKGHFDCRTGHVPAY